jgi:hypothetical protein
MRAAAGEGAAGRIVGVLGSSRSTTGGSTSAGAGRAGSAVRAPRPAPQARYSPCEPEPQSASRRIRSRSTGGRRCLGAAGRQARNSPSTPAPQSAARRDSDGRSSAGAGAGAGAGRAGGAETNGAGAGRAMGAGCTERSGTVRMAPERDPAGRWAPGRRPGMRLPSTRSRTSIRPARLLPASCTDRSAVIRAAVPVRAVSLLMSPPASRRVRSRGRCCGQGER